MLLAHRVELSDGQFLEQSLIEHLLNVADRSSKKGSLYNLSKISFVIGILHDTGKQSLFNDYLQGKYNGRVNHSSAGAKWISQINLNIPEKFEGYFETYKQIIAYVISAHHGVYDLFSGYDSNLLNRINYDVSEKYDFDGEVKPFIENELNNIVREKYNQDIYDMIMDGFFEYLDFIESNSDVDSKVSNYRLNLLTRFLLALLKDSDIVDTITWSKVDKDAYNGYENNELKNIWAIAHENIEWKYEHEFKSNSHIDKTRSDLSLNLLNRSEDILTGVYKLEMPTGAGKTISVMRLATKIANKLEKAHIIYATSYLSVLEQNANEIRNLLKLDEIVLEHHSEIIHEVKENEENTTEGLRLNYLLETWDSPVILTTLVQFFNTLMKNRSSNLRRYANIANSIIIIDEAQSIPLKSTYHFNEHLNFLAQHLNCVVILCTATQPALDSKSMLAPIKYNESSDLLKLTDRETDVFRRAINIDLSQRGTKRMDTEELILNVKRDLGLNRDSILIIVNTKKAAKEVYEKVINKKLIEEENIYYLTTNLCAAHRKDKLEQIKDKLKAGKQIIVVSTQLIEAGVNLDFEVVYRSLAGIDSIIQAEGRCNREGKRASGYLYLFDYTVENLDKLPDISRAKKATLITLKTTNYDSEFKVTSLIDEYYKNYYSDMDSKEIDIMAYPYKDPYKVTSLFDLLSEDQSTLSAYNKTNRENKFQPKLTHAYKTVGDNFELIDSNTISVIVYYNNKELINDLIKCINEYNLVEAKKILKKLQSTTINLYSLGKFQTCVSAVFNDRIYLLMEQYYDNNLGLIEESLEGLIM
ncbi:CRISPR-associated helicase Cas3' [Fundicoccus culcitae]|uniref:CRISPR-associated helicase Cas3 n=1 Tax=Fundicoccus culcitae TaxID=2969821 RepID=A0ABY5P2I6_9LACT|nr:CRISPR-associated helicase Cas3' [Fundicoccus culcitae]UUX32774.1 CRISPR-associated helicase Cas3' [Fundicoccus culcitae]